MNAMTSEQAKEFAERWLPAWSGNRPEELAAFYAEDALYLDPGVPTGVEGRVNLLAHFAKLLSYNPDWVWTQTEAIPMEDGFLNLWRANIPVGTKTLIVKGVCLVQLDRKGLIRRNEVYFDRSELLNEISIFRRNS